MATNPHHPSGFFAFRTPLLPFDELEAWDHLADPETLRDHLNGLLERPEIREALFLASPHLASSLDGWRKEPTSKKGRRSEEALVRYLLRMMTRPTPFGLFAGCSVGALGGATRLEVGERSGYRRNSRLDTDYLFALVEDLGRVAELRQQLQYRPNSSLYSAAGRLRYAEARVEGRNRSYRLVALEPNEFLEATLRRAEGGALLADLARALVDDDPDGEITLDDANDYLRQLVDAQILLPPLSPMVTGPEAIHALIEQCGELAPGVAERLARARDALAGLDDAGVGADPQSYQAIADDLASMPTKVDLPRLFQVDMVKPARATLGPEIVHELERGLALLHRIAGPMGNDPLESFRDAFRKRYEDAEVPLSEALDSEAGVGFGTGGLGSDASPLLVELAFPASPGDDKVRWNAWTGKLLAKLEALGSGSTPAPAPGAVPELEVEAKDLEALGDETLPPLPDAMYAMGTLVAASSEAIDQGNFEILFNGGGGPSGATMLGRFCHGDPELATRVQEHVRAEEALDPEAIFAEIVHLPEGRMGNIIARPRLRDYEIPLLGRGAAPSEYQIPLSDLWVSVRGGRVVLRSARLGRRVIPRLTSAHNFSSSRNLTTYRFLCLLQGEGLRRGLRWSWGVLERFAFLPRVRSGRLVLARARWRMEKSEIAKLAKTQGVPRMEAVEAWRAVRGLPRYIVLADFDNELLVDLENPLSVDAFVAVVRRREQATLLEFFPGPEKLCVGGPEGRFTHELIVPFLRQAAEGETGRRTEAHGRPGGETIATTEAPAVRRIFPPGSEWLYLKLYTGHSNADRLLSEMLSPLLPRLKGSFERWFFIRYGDPDWHLRLRFQGDPRELHGVVLPALQDAAAQYMDAGWLHRIQLDTYGREIERYGGDHGIELAERIAHVDSEAVLAIVELLDGDEGAEARWRLALRGSGLLLEDLGLIEDTGLEVARRIQSGFAREHRFDGRIRKQLSARLRKERRELEVLLAPEWSEEHPFSPGFEILEERSRRLKPIIEELRQRAEAGRLSLPVAALAPSYIHMFNNRLLRSQARAHEAVLYDMLYRLLHSRSLRRKSRGEKRDG